MKTTKTYMQSPYRRRGYLWLGLGVLVLISGVAYLLFRPKATEIVSNLPNTKLPADTSSSVIPGHKPGTQPALVLESHELTVPYAPQAPLSNWAVHEESCEEAALYMYHGYLASTKYPANRIPDAEADSVFRTMKAWQATNYGSEPDLTMTALGVFASSYYGYSPIVKKSITAEDIKAAISAGHPVIVPVMTHSLENSMYGPVSVYHVLLIKGYDAAGVITNDAGVGNGVNKHYTWQVLWQAIDAQTAKMGQGREMLYLTK